MPEKPSDRLEEALDAISRRTRVPDYVTSGANITHTNAVIGTDWWALDHGILTLGGFPVGRMALIYGPEQSGKTVICLRVVAQAQRQGGVCVWFDAENCLFDEWGKKWATTQGVDVDTLLGSDDLTAEHIMESAFTLSETGLVKVIVIDSIASLCPTAQQDDEKLMGHRGKVGGDVAMVLSQGLKQLAGSAHRNGVLVLLTNQIRAGMDFGNSEVLPGGKAQLFHSSQILRVEKRSDIFRDDDKKAGVIGNEAMVVLRKSKVSPRGKRTGVDTPGHLRIYYDGRKEDDWETHLHFAKKAGLVEMKGVWYSFGEVKGQGMEGFKRALEEKGQYAELLRQVTEKSYSSAEEIEDDGIAVE